MWYICFIDGASDSETISDSIGGVTHVKNKEKEKRGNDSCDNMDEFNENDSNSNSNSNSKTRNAGKFKPENIYFFFLCGE